MKNSTAANVVYKFKRYTETKLIRTIDRRKRAGEDVIDNGDVPQYVTDHEGNRVWSFA